MNRRRFLGASAAAGLAGLAGCSTALGSVAPPEVPAQKLESGGWKQTADDQYTVFEKTFGGVDVTAKAHTLTYQDAALSEKVSAETLDQVKGQFAIFSATHVDMAPNLDNLPIAKGKILDETETNARKQFVDRMQKAGLKSVQRTNTGTLTVDTGEDARLTEYTAVFPFQTITFPVSKDKEITIEGDPIGVAGSLAVWHHGDYVLIAGGAYPDQNFSRHIQKQLSEAITVTVDIDLGLQPDAYASELRSLVTAVQ